MIAVDPDSLGISTLDVDTISSDVHSDVIAVIDQTSQLHSTGHARFKLTRRASDVQSGDDYQVSPIIVRQQRTDSGLQTQLQVAQYLKSLVGEGKFEMISTARIGSTAPDLVVEIDSTLVQVEVKGLRSHTRPITFFDKSLRRGDSSAILDRFAEFFTNGELRSFSELVDDYKRSQDDRVGFPGDAGVPKSGRLPSAFIITNSTQLVEARKLLIERFDMNHDNYVAIHNRQHNTTTVFHTGIGPNPLKAPHFPALLSLATVTYGGASCNAMRVGLKAKLPTQE